MYPLPNSIAPDDHLCISLYVSLFFFVFFSCKNARSVYETRATTELLATTLPLAPISMCWPCLARAWCGFSMFLCRIRYFGERAARASHGDSRATFEFWETSDSTWCERKQRRNNHVSVSGQRSTAHAHASKLKVQHYRWRSLFWFNCDTTAGTEKVCVRRGIEVGERMMG